MNNIDILIEGYLTIMPEKGWEASSSAILITTDTNRILVDPGCNREKLLDALQARNIPVEDINCIFLTHHHLDHAMNIALFPNAKVIDFEAIYAGDIGELRGDTIPGTDVTILPTPGHEYGHASLLIPTQEGIVAAAGDVFMWEDNEEQTFDMEKPDDFATDMKQLKASRKTLLEVADWIIPGHGKMIRNNRE